METVNYDLVLADMYRIEGGLLCGSHAEIAIMDGGREVDRIRRNGMIRDSSYRIPYQGKPGLTAVLLSGKCQVRFGVAGAAHHG
ncbi:hypothetical protein [Stutzerimonas nitrititolerans]|uniref:hypothetical protein n=1 Tax=Stutzerimonas nitrititolerans TaxID=2482751 RepID=UPI0028AB1C5F|nr:hypothetical protein [Stutzerimonas nitrititolerans]